MTTSIALLDPSQYVQVNLYNGPVILQAFRDDVRIAFSDTQPTFGNTAYHTLGGDDNLMEVDSFHRNVWALPTSDRSSLVVTDLSSGMGYEDCVVTGKIPGHSVVHKFGHCLADTTIRPVTTSTTYQTPTTAQSLEIVSDNAADTVGGVGAQKVNILGLDANWDEIEQEVSMNGTTPVPIPVSLIRHYRNYVTETGTYATQGSGSAVGNITVRDQATGLVIWSTLPNTPWPLSQSEIGVYTIPRGYTGYLLSKEIFVDGNKSAELYFFQRPKADDITPPYTGAMRLVQREVGVTGQVVTRPRTPKGPFVGPCDIGFMGRMTSQTGDISVEFELLMVQDGY